MTTPRYILTTILDGEALRHGPLSADDALDLAVEVHGKGHTEIALIDLDYDRVLPLGDYMR